MTSRVARASDLVGQQGRRRGWADRRRLAESAHVKGHVMSSITAEVSTTAERDRARHALIPVAAASFLVAAFFDLARADSTGEALSMVAFGLLVVCLLYPLVVARGLRAENSAGRALVLGVLGVLL